MNGNSDEKNGAGLRESGQIRRVWGATERSWDFIWRRWKALKGPQLLGEVLRGPGDVCPFLGLRSFSFLGN